MYHETFGLSEAPFQLTPDSRYIFLSKMHKRAKAYMDYAVWKRDGFIVLTGEIGAGKTTLINKLLSEKGEGIEVIRIFQTQLNEVEFLQAILLELGVDDSEIHGLGKVELLHRLNHHLIDTYSKGKHVVLIIDEGQNLSTTVLEEIRMLSGLELDKEKLLNIILVGQPEMNLILDQPNMEQLIQRIRLRYHLGSLSQKETVEYVKHRLKVAGSRNPDKIFNEKTFPIIQDYTGGIPRKINVLCDTAMVCAFADNKRVIDIAVVEDAISELQWIKHVDSKSKKQSSTGQNIKESVEDFSTNDAPVITIGSDQWRDVFSSLIKVMGDVTDRLNSLDKRLNDINKSIERLETDSANKVSHFSPGRSKNK